MKTVTLLLLTGLLAVATVALDSAYAEPPPPTVDIPGLTGEDFAPEALTVLMVCGIPVAMVERVGEQVTLWVGMPLMVRGQILNADPRISNRLELSAIYPGKDWGCETAGAKPKAPEWGA